MHISHPILHSILHPITLSTPNKYYMCIYTYFTFIPTTICTMSMSLSSAINTTYSHATAAWLEVPKWFAPGELTITIENGDVTLRVKLSSFYSLVRILRDQSMFQFKTLVDMTAIDYPSREPRFDVVYHRLSVRYQTRCCIVLQADERTDVPSLTPLYQSAGWTERECFDMFGIGFEGHPDLRRILTDYGFEGHPRRKDFPLTGFTEVRYDEAAKRVVCEPLERSQDYRAFDFRSAWKSLPDTVIVKGTDKV